MRTVRVELGERSYDIRIGAGLLDGIGRWLKELGAGRSGLVVSDRNVASLYGEKVVSSIEQTGLRAVLLALPAGEEHKNLDQTKAIYEEMLRDELDRSSFALALGGGVVGDITGFAAATFLRGITFLQAPTTLLAQVDASVGGKVAVNLPEGKNLVGAFYQPRGVLIDPSVLATLDARHLGAGFAEVIKHAVIRDARHFAFLEENRERALSLDPACLERVIEASCRIKADVVARDEKEKGLRMILNFGHTIGHALEAATGYRHYLHGEAVAVGAACAARISCRLGNLAADECRRIISLFERYGLPVRTGAVGSHELIAALRRDKKIREGKVRFVLPRRIGEVFLSGDVPEKIVREAVEGKLRNPH